MPLVIAYMNQVGFDTETQDKVHSYMSILVRRASGELLTGVIAASFFFFLVFDFVELILP